MKATKTKTTNNTESLLSKHRRYRNLFVVLSVLGLLDLATLQLTNVTDIGFVSYGVAIASSTLLGQTAGSVLGTFVSVVLSLVIFWIPIAIIEHRYISKLLARRSSAA